MKLKLKLKIFRFDPERDTSPRYEEYEVGADPKDSLLNILLRIRDERDPTLAFSYSCRRGACGSCAVRINGVPMLACQTTIEKLVEEFGNEITVEPLSISRVVRDLVVDSAMLWSLMKRTSTRISRLERYIPPETIDPKTVAELQRYRRCISCLACLDACPVYRLDRRFRGPFTMRLLYRYVADPRDGLDRVREAWRDGLYLCLVCDACTAVCYQNIEIGEAVVKMRAKAFEQGLAPRRLMDALEGVKDPDYGNPLWLPREERGAWIEGLSPSEKGEILVFAGCMASYADKESVRALARILEIAGFEYRVLGAEELCCGMPLYLAGDLSGMRKLAESNLKKFKDLGVKVIVTPCPSCYRAMKSLYPRVGVDLETLGIRILHATQFLHSLLKSGRLRIMKPLNIELTYHDPCDLGRHEGIYKEPREILEVIGVKLIEMRRHGPYAMCCGAGGNLRIVDPELSLSIGVERLKDIPKGIRIVAHACPTCRIQFSEAAERAALDIENVSIQELVLRALRES